MKKLPAIEEEISVSPSSSPTPLTPLTPTPSTPLTALTPPTSVVQSNTKYFETRLEELFSPEELQQTVEFMKEWKPSTFSNIITNVDIDDETKHFVGELFFVLGWIDDLSHAVLLCALHNQFTLASLIVTHQQQHKPKCEGFGWKTLRKCLGNWDLCRDRKKLKELCLHIMTLDVKAMSTLNTWAIQHAKEQHRIIKGYCDFLNGDAKKFAMMYSEL